MSRLSAVTAVATLLALAGCGSSSKTKFTQTWPRPYDQTTCMQWLKEMTDEQKFTAAADMLVGARSTDDKNADLPAADVIDQFTDEISQGCVPFATMTITDAALSIYLIGRDQYRP